jgi:hypothetical protein
MADLAARVDPFFQPPRFIVVLLVLLFASLIRLADGSVRSDTSAALLLVVFSPLMERFLPIMLSLAMASFLSSQAYNIKLPSYGFKTISMIFF